MARRDRVQRTIRGPSTVAPRRRILIVCEGTVTEPQYFESFTRWKKNPAVEVTVQGPAGDPVTLVNIAKERKKSADEHAARDGDPNLAFDEVWCCFDVDMFGSRVPQARSIAQTSGLHLAMSNPCFELWLILHLRENPGPQDHHKMQAVWKERQPDLDNKHVDFEVLKAGYEAAVLRAQRLLDDARADGEPPRNPTTEVHLLTESIDADGRERRAKAAEAARRALDQADREQLAEEEDP